MPPLPSAALGMLALALALAAAPGCRTRFEPEPVPVSEAAVQEASRTLHAAAQERDDLELAEGGVLMDLRFYEWQEWEVWETQEEILLPGVRPGPYVHRTERVRVLGRRRRVYVRLESLEAVYVRSWAMGAGIELELEGEPEPAFLEAPDRAAAERLASALDVLRRAREAASEPPPPDAE